MGRFETSQETETRMVNHIVQKQQNKGSVKYRMLLLKLSCSVVSTICDSMDCSLPSSSVHGISQARILKWVAISFSKGLCTFKDGGSRLCQLRHTGWRRTTENQRGWLRASEHILNTVFKSVLLLVTRNKCEKRHESMSSSL